VKKVITVLAFIAINYACASSTNGKQELDDQETFNSAEEGAVSKLIEDSVKNIKQQMIEEMQKLSLSGSADRDYADLMIIHHNTTQRLAGFEFARGEHLNVARTAERIASKDNKEMLIFKNFSLSYKQVQQLDSFRVEINQLINGLNDSVPSTITVDSRFIDLMVEHEQTAIDISKVYLKYAKDAKLKIIARNIILNNQKEIPKLKSIKPH
jgi:uncharacterized protein (DUF305 family)